LRDALKTNPNHAEIHWELGYAYRFAGMLSESVSECEHARRLDPGVKLNSSTPNGYLYLGQYDRFLDSLAKTDDVALIVFYRGFGEYYKKNSEQAETNFDHAFEFDPSLLQAEIGRAFSFEIRHQNHKAAEILHGLETKINERGVVDPEATYKIAQAYAAIGDNVSSLRVLRHSIENGFFPYPYFAVDPLLDSLRGEDEFPKLMNTARQRHEGFKSRFFLAAKRSKTMDAYCQLACREGETRFTSPRRFVPRCSSRYAGSVHGCETSFVLWFAAPSVGGSHSVSSLRFTLDRKMLWHTLHCRASE
jgi:tetratricopeptide (TPR) repeat protein